MQKRLSYPTAPTADQVDDFHGEAIADPYRPLEDTDAPATRAWIDAQNALTAAVLAEVSARPAIRERLAEVWDHPRAGAPFRRGTHWFQLRNSGLQDQDVLWVADAPDAKGRVLIDPNGLSDDGTTALSAFEASEDGELVAYATSDAGSDWRTWRVRRTASGEDLPDTIGWSKTASAAWTHDGAGFVYGRYPEPPADDAYDAPQFATWGSATTAWPRSRERHRPALDAGSAAMGIRAGEHVRRLRGPCPLAGDLRLNEPGADPDQRSPERGRLAGANCEQWC